MVPTGTVDVADAARVSTAPPLLEVKVAGTKLLLLRRPDGTLRAFPAACPHLGRPLRKAALDGEVLTCPAHRHRYDVQDGRCVWPGGPHDDGLELFEVGETAGRVWVRPPTEGR